MGPRRTSAALAVLALGVVTLTAGAAAAFCGDDALGTVARQHGYEGRDHQSSDHQTWDHGGSDHDDGVNEQFTGGQAAGGNSGVVTGNGDGSGSGTGTPPVPVEAPAAAASGPAPDAAVAAPAPAVATDTFVAAAGSDTLGTPVPAPEAAAPAAPSGLEGLDALPVLGSLDDITNRVTDGPAAARELLSTRTGRSLLVIGALLIALAIFLAVHRRTDRGDTKLAAARSGPEVARFR